MLAALTFSVTREIVSVPDQKEERITAPSSLTSYVFTESCSFSFAILYDSCLCSLWMEGGLQVLVLVCLHAPRVRCWILWVVAIYQYRKHSVTAQIKNNRCCGWIHSFIMLFMTHRQISPSLIRPNFLRTLSFYSKQSKQKFGKIMALALFLLL